MSESNPPEAAAPTTASPPQSEEDVVSLDDVTFADEFVPQNPTPNLPVISPEPSRHSTGSFSLFVVQFGAPICGFSLLDPLGSAVF